MFKIGSGRFTWMAVNWKGLADDGTEVENAVQLQVELVGREALQAQLDAEKAGDADMTFLPARVRNWKDVGDVDGSPLTFSAENFKLLFDAPGFAAAMGEAYLNAWRGISGIREKNSETSPGAGPPAAAPDPKPAG